MRGFNKYFCFSLRAGAIIIAWIGLTVGIMSVIVGFVQSIETQFVYTVKNGTRELDEEYNYYSPHQKHVVYASILSGLVEITVDILLMYGVIKRNKFYLLPWLILNALMVVSGFVYFCTIFIIFGLDVALIFLVAFMVFCVYTWLCVLNLYLRFQTESANNNQAHEIINFLPKLDDVILPPATTRGEEA